MKRFLLSISFIALFVTIGIVFSASVKPTLAQQDGTGPAPILQSPTAFGYEIIPYKDDVPLSYIDGDTDKVVVKFYNIDSTIEKVYACLYTDNKGKCLDPSLRDLEVIGFKNVTDSIESDRTLTLEVCADGNDKLKIGCGKKDYFHEGRTYKVALYEGRGAGEELFFTEFETATLFVHHYYPEIHIASPNGYVSLKKNPEYHLDSKKPAYILNPDNPDKFDEEIEISNPIQVTLIGHKRDNSNNKRNNYQVTVDGVSVDFGSGDEGDICTKITDQETTVRIGRDTRKNNGNNPFFEGRYLLKISDQNQDTRSLGNAVRNINEDGCHGGFTFFHIPFEVGINEEGKKTTFILEYDIEIDPNFSDFKKLSSSLNRSPLPCTRGLNARGESTTAASMIVDCEEFATAIGDFAPRPIAFIQSITKLLLGIGAMATLAYLIYGGIIILTSRGDKEKLQKAREMITSAVIGLVFIFLSFVILAFIGIDVLGLNGFER